MIRNTHPLYNFVLLLFSTLAVLAVFFQSPAVLGYGAFALVLLVIFRDTLLERLAHTRLGHWIAYPEMHLETTRLDRALRRPGSPPQI